MDRQGVTARDPADRAHIEIRLAITMPPNLLNARLARRSSEHGPDGGRQGIDRSRLAER
jgi:hypothetical protein